MLGGDEHLDRHHKAACRVGDAILLYWPRQQPAKRIPLVIQRTEGGADTVMVREQPVFAVAIFAYALSFGLVAVSAKGGVSVPGFACAYYTLVMVPRFPRDHMNVAWLISGWINIVVLASLAMRWWEGNRRPFKILRAITLLMIPFCWIVFYDGRLFPREGHSLWVASMVLALFSEGSSSSPVITADSQPRLT